MRLSRQSGDFSRRGTWTRRRATSFLSRAGSMTVPNKTAQRVTAMAFIAVLASSVGFGQVKTTVPDVVPGARPATVERITIHGKALEGNLEGDAVDRPVLVFLPPSYARERNRRYPVVYALHGYSIGAEQWFNQSIKLFFHLRIFQRILRVPHWIIHSFGQAPSIGKINMYNVRHRVGIHTAQFCIAFHLYIF